MNYKMIALDLDGTLLTAEKTILPETKKALIDIQKKGVKVVLSSGRPVPGMEFIAEQLELHKYGGYILSFNGGQIVDCKTNKVIAETSINVNDAHRVYDLSIIHNTNIITYIDNKVYGEFFDEYVEVETTINKMEFVEVDNLLDAITKPVPKFIMLQDGDYVEKIIPLVAEELEDKFTVTRSEPYFLEVMPKGIDKGSSLEKLAQMEGIKQEEVIACGDSYNDITMVEYAGLGVAMDNAKQEVKDASDYVTLSNEDNGIANVIEKFIKF